MSALKTNGTRTGTAMDAGPTTPSPTARETPSDKGAGWILFATVMFVVAACLNVIWGIAAVSSSHFFVGNADYILSGLNTWGWVAIVFGACQGLAALSIWRGGQVGRWFGVGVAALAVIAAMMSIPAYPFWSLTLVALDVLIIYGLVAYGGKPGLMR